MNISFVTLPETYLSKLRYVNQTIWAFRKLDVRHKYEAGELIVFYKGLIAIKTLMSAEVN